MKNLKKLLNQEMDERISPMSEDLKNYSITPREKKKKSFALPLGLGFSFASVLAVVLIAVLFFIKPASPNTYYVVEINPTIMIEADSNNKIVSLKSGNSDADSFLVDLNIEGKELEEGMQTIAYESMREGYFNPEAAGVLRVSTIGGEDNLPAVKKSLEESFMVKGYYVAVAQNVFDLSDLNKMLNTAYKSFDSFYSNLKPRTYMNNEVTEDDISTFYRDHDLAGFLFNEINKNLDKLEALKPLVEKMYEQNNKIYHEFGSFAGNKDYWDFVKLENPSPELKLELDIMTGYLTEYEKLTGETIRNYSGLLREYSKLRFANIDSLRDIVKDLEDFSKKLESSFNTVIDIINKTLNLLPSFDQAISELTSLPNTIEEYYTKLNLIEKNKKNDRILDNKRVYNEDREIISDSSYNSFINEIIKKFVHL